MNPAERLLKIYDKLVGRQQDRQMVKVWAEVFDLDLESKNLEDEVIPCIVALRAQIDFAHARLLANGVPNWLTNPGFDRLKNVASPANFSQSWSGLRGNIQPPECRLAFAWGAWVLRDECEEEISTEELSELVRSLDALETALTETDISPYLHDFIHRQISTIRTALRIYGVQGARPIQEAMRKVVGDMKVEEGALIQENKAADGNARSVLAKTAEVIEKTAKVCDSLDKIKKFGEGFSSLASKIIPALLPYIDKVTGG